MSNKDMDIEKRIKKITNKMGKLTINGNGDEDTAEALSESLAEVYRLREKIFKKYRINKLSWKKFVRIKTKNMEIGGETKDIMHWMADIRNEYEHDGEFKKPQVVVGRVITNSTLVLQSIYLGITGRTPYSLSLETISSKATGELVEVLTKPELFDVRDQLEDAKMPTYRWSKEKHGNFRASTNISMFCMENKKSYEFKYFYTGYK